MVKLGTRNTHIPQYLCVIILAILYIKKTKCLKNHVQNIIQKATEMFFTLYKRIATITRPHILNSVHHTCSNVSADGKSNVRCLQWRRLEHCTRLNNIVRNNGG